MQVDIVISEPDAEAVSQVRLGETRLGCITAFGNMHIWHPADPMPYGMEIAQNVSFHLDDLVDLLQHKVASQVVAFEKGEEPDTELLHPDLRPYVQELELMGMRVNHPWVCQATSPALVATVNASYKGKRQAVKEALKTKNWTDYIWLHERAYRTDALQTLSTFLSRGWISRTKFWELVGSVWRDSESIHAEQVFWQSVWSIRCDFKAFAMSAEERKAFACLPKRIPIYRGCATADAVKGFSWTLSKPVAMRFARRSTGFAKPGILATMTVDRRNICAYFTSRGKSENDSEQEVVILPSVCKNPKITVMSPEENRPHE